jgi:hypothetical protein
MYGRLEHLEEFKPGHSIAIILSFKPDPEMGEQ